MARTYDEILNELQTAKAGEAALSVYTNTSGTSRWQAWLRAMALAQWLQENIIDLLKAQIQTIASAQYYGTLPWYVSVAKEFRYGGTLSVENGQVVQTGGAQIVSSAAAVESDRTVTLKVAMASGGGQVALPPAEKAAFEVYMKKRKVAGIKMNVVSLNADKLRVVASVYYDGQRVQADIRAAIQAALEAYMAALPFNGDVYVSKIQDALQAVDGVLDVQIASVSLFKSGSYAPVTRVLGTASGYLEEDDAPGSTFNNTITLIPQ